MSEGVHLKHRYRNPAPTVDIIIATPRGVVLIKRRNPPYGWAIPGGFVDYGETVEKAARREAMEETGLKLQRLKQFHVYSDPRRDPRQHTIATVFTASAMSDPKAGDDAAEAKVFRQREIPRKMAFDHAKILRDYFMMKRKKR